MPDTRCCRRPLFYEGYIGASYADHQAADTHDWLDSGDFCCLNWPAQYKRQICWCNGSRWVERDADHVTGP